MYSKYHDQIVAGVESFPPARIACENLLYLLTWGIAAYLLWSLWLPAGVPVLAIAWVVLVLIVQILLKKHNCSGCYYYNKQCHLGWGKLASLLYAQDSGNPDVGKVLSLFYVVTPPLVLLVAIIGALFNGLAWYYWTAVGLYVVLSLLAFPVRVAGCRVCDMRRVCPGSAAKGL